MERLLLGSKETKELIKMNDEAIKSMAIDSKKDFGVMSSPNSRYNAALNDINASLQKVTPSKRKDQKTPVELELVEENINALNQNLVFSDGQQMKVLMLLRRHVWKNCRTVLISIVQENSREYK